MNLSFAGDSEFLISVSQGSRPQLSVWSMTKLSVSWSYKLHVEGLILSFVLLLELSIEVLFGLNMR